MSSLDTIRISKAYKLYDPIKKKLVISRDIELNEEIRWDWKNQQEELLIKEVEMRLPVRDNSLEFEKL
jgi:hypothetical protein